MDKRELAIEIALKAHKGQVDKARAPYILHPLRVAAFAKTEMHYIIAVLHDVVEDTDVTFDDIEKDFGIEVRNAIDALTRREEEYYSDFIVRCSQNNFARQVKLWDLFDNSDLRRLDKIGEGDIRRVEKYKHSMDFLHGVIDIYQFYNFFKKA